MQQAQHRCQIEHSQRTESVASAITYKSDKLPGLAIRNQWIPYQKNIEKCESDR